MEKEGEVKVSYLSPWQHSQASPWSEGQEGDGDVLITQMPGDARLKGVSGVTAWPHRIMVY